RAFLACEPENRLVARTLETRWETTLADLAEAQAALAVQAQAQPELPSPDQLATTIADLPALWSATTTSDKDRKRLLRTLLADVTITRSADDPAQISVGLRWKSGASQQVQVTRRKNAIQLRTTDPAAIELARRIGPPATTTPSPKRSTMPGTAPAPGSPSTASPPPTCATTTTSPTPACSTTAS
ncbi:MAG TPA: hypothetical protein VLW50_31635, partial [Streptosporangiaceae bacterium]|nr:hypothetical protein [Streptosporangiaceae bacterium]